MVAMVTSPSFLGAWNILPFLFLYLCIHTHHHQKLMSDNQLCDKDALWQRCFVSPCSAIFLPAGKTSEWKHPDPLSSTKEALLQMSEPPHGQKLLFSHDPALRPKPECRNVDRLENHQPHHKGAPHPPLAHHSEPWRPNRKRFVSRLVLCRHFMLLVPLVTI